MGGDVSQDPQHPQADDQPVRGRPGREPEGHPERLDLMIGNRAHLPEERPAEQVQRGERKLQLGLDSDDLDATATGGPLRDVLEQGGFADPRLAAEDNRVAPAAAHPVQGVVERLPLSGASAQVRRHGGHLVTIGVVGHYSHRTRQAPPVAHGGYRQVVCSDWLLLRPSIARTVLWKGPPRTCFPATLKRTAKNLPLKFLPSRTTVASTRVVPSGSGVRV